MRPYAKALSQSSHAGSNCYACHAGASTGGWVGMKVREFTRMYPAALAGATVGGPSSTVERSRCLRCHADDMDLVTDVGVRIRHSTCAPTGSCDTCHSAVAHGAVTRWISEPSMEDCIACHRQSDAPTECDSCHADRAKKDRLASSPWAVTHGPDWQSTHGMGDLRSCDVCHKPSKCASCHKIGLPHPPDFAGTHPQSAIAYRAACLQCHDVKRFCDQCHGVPMPHPSAFLKEHPKVVAGVDDLRCAKCHRVEDCVTCHVAHTHPGTTDGTLKGSLGGGDR